MIGLDHWKKKQNINIFLPLTFKIIKYAYEGRLALHQHCDFQIEMNILTARVQRAASEKKSHTD